MDCNIEEGVPEGRGRMIDGKGARHYDKLVYNDELRAYHALLTAQALYKAYIPATSDSIINRAWDYYKDHGSYDRRIRAMLYKGTTAEETGHPDTAMYWYKLTELESRSDDHYYRGFSQMNMGILFQQNYETKEAINKYREAIVLFYEHYPDYYIFCCQQLSQLYQKKELGIDSSMYFINIVKQISTNNNDSLYLALALSTEASKLYYDSCYNKARTLSVATIQMFKEKTPFQCWHYASQSYAEERMLDSAEFYFNKSPRPVTTIDSTLYFHSLYLIYSLKGNWQNAHKYEVLSDSLVESKLIAYDRPSLLKNEKEAEMALSSQHANKTNKSHWILTTAIIAVLVLLGLFIIRIILFHKKKIELYLRQQVQWLEENNQKFISEFDKINQKQNVTENELITIKEKLQNQVVENIKLRESQTHNEFVKSLYAQLSITFSQNIQPLGEIASDYFQVKNNATLFMKRFHAKFNSLWKSNDIWHQIENYINNNRNNCFSRLLKLHPNITNEEQHLILLLLLGFNSMAIAICLGYKSQNVVYSVKSRLKKKLKIDESIEEYIIKLENSK